MRQRACDSWNEHFWSESVSERRPYFRRKHSIRLWRFLDRLCLLRFLGGLPHITQTGGSFGIIASDSSTASERAGKILRSITLG